MNVKRRVEKLEQRKAAEETPTLVFMPVEGEPDRYQNHTGTYTAEEVAAMAKRAGRPAIIVDM